MLRRLFIFAGKPSRREIGAGACAGASARCVSNSVNPICTLRPKLRKDLGKKKSVFGDVKRTKLEKVQKKVEN